jgi:cysteine desulfurase/selenocysteine lyase
VNIAELQQNEELRHHEFPVTRKSVFLGHAGVCPLPRRVSEAMHAYSQACTLGDQEAAVEPGFFMETRQLAASLIDAQVEEIALVGPTSLALSFVAEGLTLPRNSNILVYQDDYPSNVYPWMTMAEKGVEVRFLNIRELGLLRARDIFGQVDENTKLVALASCHFLSGYRIALDELGKGLRARGIMFCVDGIQTLGAFPTSASQVDFMAADAHKWLLGPCGAGVMFVRRERQGELRPIVHGWHNLRCPNYVALDDLIYKPDARRYEAGTHNLVGLAGLNAALKLLTEIGIEKIGRDLLRKRAWLVPALQERGWTVLHGSAPPENSGPMISFHKPGLDLAEVHQRLLGQNIITSLRADRTGQKYIRISPHFYNTDAELQRVLAFL